MGTVRYLLDTHSLLWAVSDNRKIGKNAKKIMDNPDIPLYVSSVSAYEITNKFRIGKLPGYTYIIDNYQEVLDDFNVLELPISTKHAHYAGKFDWNHRDPFDRIIAAQAFLDDFTLITNDPEFNSLSWIKVLW